MRNVVLPFFLLVAAACASENAVDDWPCATTAGVATVKGGIHWTPWENLAGRVVSKVDPEIPAGTRLEALVSVEAVIGPDGEVKCARIADKKTTHPLVEEPALDSARSYRFDRTQKSDKPATIATRIPLEFSTAGVSRAESRKRADQPSR